MSNRINITHWCIYRISDKYLIGEYMIKYLKKFNDKVAVLLTRMVSTMWCAYVFAAIAFISFPAALTGGTSVLISWIAQTFLQLVLLSVIMVGQEVQSKKSERRAIQDHLMLTQQLKDIKEISENLKKLEEKHD